jgi:DNA transposition AAA+ family ATPase
MNDSSPDDTADRRLDVTHPYWTWADVLGHNLRRFRKEGYKVDEMDSLRRHALDEVKRIHDKYGWPLPPTTLPGVQTLGD